MIRRILQEKNFIACALAAITGIVLYFRYPFPEGNFFLRTHLPLGAAGIPGVEVFLHIVSVSRPLTSSIRSLLSGIYIFTLKTPPRPKAGKAYRRIQPRPIATIYSSYSARSTTHERRCPRKHPTGSRFQNVVCSPGSPSSAPLAVERPVRALYPYAEQILAYEAANPEKRIGGLVLEVKGDFCRKVRAILARHRT